MKELTAATVERLRESIRQHMQDLFERPPEPVNVKSLLKLHFALQEVTMEDSGRLVHMYSRQTLGRVLLDQCKLVEDGLHIVFVPNQVLKFINITVDLK